MVVVSAMLDERRIKTAKRTDCIRLAIVFHVPTVSSGHFFFCNFPKYNNETLLFPRCVDFIFVPNAFKFRRYSPDVRDVRLLVNGGEKQNLVASKKRPVVC